MNIMYVCVCSMLFVCLFFSLTGVFVCFTFHCIVVERENMMVGGERNGEELGRVGGGEQI